NLRAVRLTLLEPALDRWVVRRVDDEQVLTVTEPIRDQVVDDPATLVGEQRVLRFAVTQAGEIVRQHLLEERECGRTVDVELSHVRDVEGPTARPDRAVLRDDALV